MTPIEHIIEARKHLDTLMVSVAEPQAPATQATALNMAMIAIQCTEAIVAAIGESRPPSVGDVFASSQLGAAARAGVKIAAAHVNDGSAEAQAHRDVGVKP